MRVVDKLWLYDKIETKIQDLINNWDTMANVKADIKINTNYIIDFDGDNIVWKDNLKLEALELAFSGLKELEEFYDNKKEVKWHRY